MTSPNNIELIHGDGEPAGSQRLSQAIEVLQARIAEEFQVAERINTKGRQVFALLTAFFAFAQTISFGGLGIAHPSGAAAVLLAVIAAFALLALAINGHRVMGLEELQPEAYIKADKIVEWAKGGTDLAFSRQAVVNMAEVANRRRESNQKRAGRYKGVESSARWAIVLTAAEILIAIIFLA